MLGMAIAVCYLLAVFFIAARGLDDSLSKADMIVVPGNTVEPNGIPSPRLQARLDAAITVFREGYAPLVFVSGGTGKEGIDEAVAMANYLIAKGIPASAIVIDSQGVDTASTARNASAFMRAKQLKSAIVATQFFHVARTKLALERHGIEVKGNVHARYSEFRDIYSLFREVAAYAAYHLSC